MICANCKMKFVSAEYFGSFSAQSSTSWRWPHHDYSVQPTVASNMAWVPMWQRAIFKTAGFVWKCVPGTARGQCHEQLYVSAENVWYCLWLWSASTGWV